MSWDLGRKRHDVTADKKTDDQVATNPGVNGGKGKNSTRPIGDSFARGDFINQRGNMYNWDLGSKLRDVAANKKTNDQVGVNGAQRKNRTRLKGDAFAKGNFYNQGGNVMNHNSAENYKKMI